MTDNIIKSTAKDKFAGKQVQVWFNEPFNEYEVMVIDKYYDGDKWQEYAVRGMISNSATQTEINRQLDELKSKLENGINRLI